MVHRVAILWLFRSRAWKRPGSGSLLLRLARQLHSACPRVAATLHPRQDPLAGPWHGRADGALRFHWGRRPAVVLTLPPKLLLTSSKGS